MFEDGLYTVTLQDSIFLYKRTIQIDAAGCCPALTLSLKRKQKLQTGACNCSYRSPEVVWVSLILRSAKNAQKIRECAETLDCQHHRLLEIPLKRCKLWAWLPLTIVAVARNSQVLREILKAFQGHTCVRWKKGLDSTESLWVVIIAAWVSEKLIMYAWLINL